MNSLDAECVVCGADDWYLHFKNGNRQRVCRPCKLRKNREWAARNRDKRLASVLKYQAKNPLQKRESYLRRNYGMGLAEFDELLASQGGVCAICGSDNPKGGHNWHVDHDHATGAVRGILCYACNTSLGFVEDSTETLQRMIDYLLRSKVGL